MNLPKWHAPWPPNRVDRRYTPKTGMNLGMEHKGNPTPPPVPPTANNLVTDTGDDLVTDTGNRIIFY